MNNKKIKNATEIVSSGIKFKSKLEALIYKVLGENGITPQYETRTFEFVPKLRPTIPFFNRIGKVFGVDMRPIRPITYTPDFIFNYNGMLVVIEAKGFENDVFYVKRNLFRRHLEELKQPAIYFEIRTKKELLEALKIIKMESPIVQNIRKLIQFLPEKDIPVGNAYLNSRNWEELYNLVTSAITRIRKSLARGLDKYKDIDINVLYQLQAIIPNDE